MKMRDIAKKNTAELKKLITEKEGELREFRFSVSGAAGKKNVRAARVMRKVIARAKTALKNTSASITNETK